MIDLQPGMYIRFHSYEEERELLAELERLGYKWLSGDCPTALSYFHFDDANNNVYYLLKYEKSIARSGMPQEEMANVIDWDTNQMQISIGSIDAFV